MPDAKRQKYPNLRLMISLTDTNALTESEKLQDRQEESDLSGTS